MSDIPNFWRKRTLISYLLYPLSLLFNLIYRFRKYKLTKKQCQPSVNTIIIGNITVGGNGKTPIVIALANALKSHYQVAIITRGYGGKASTAFLVHSDSTVAESGDEPLLIHKETQLPVMVSIDRMQGINLLLNKFPDLDFVISDDGLQHYRMPRSQEYIIIAPDFLLGNGFTIPAGPLREKMTRLDSVNAVLYTGAVEQIIPTKTRSYQCEMHNQNFIHWQSQEPIADKSMLNNCNALTSIARPARFFDQLASLNIEIAEKKTFPDHYLFAQSEIQFKDPSAYIIMTSKDAIKTQGWPDSILSRIIVLKYEAQPPDAFIQQVIQEKTND